MKLLLPTNFFALLTLLLPATVNGLVTDCAVAEGWGNLVASFTNTLSYATDGYFQVVGTLTLPTSGDCPSSWRAYQTIEAGTTSCFAAPIVVTAGPSSVVTVTYIYEDCPANMEEIARTITLNESHWIQTDNSEGGVVFSATSSVVTLPSSSADSTTSSSSQASGPGSSINPGGPIKTTTPTATPSATLTGSNTLSTSTLTTQVVTTATGGSGGSGGSGGNTGGTTTAAPSVATQSSQAASIRFCSLLIGLFALPIGIIISI